MGKLIIILAIIAATLIVFEPKLDSNKETGEILLWYNWNGKRHYLIIWRLL